LLIVKSSRNGSYIDEFLDLGGCKHPTDIENDLNIRNCSLLQLEKLGSLLKVFQLKGSFRHIVALAPFFDSGDVVVDL